MRWAARAPPEGRLGSGSACSTSPAPRGEPPPGAAPERARRRRASGRAPRGESRSPKPEAAAARRSAAAASPEPPPKAGGDRHALDDAQTQRRRIPAGGSAERGERGGGEVLRGRREQVSETRAHHDVAARAGIGRGLQRELVRQRDRLHHRRQLVAAVRARGTEEQTEVDLRGGERAQWQGAHGECRDRGEAGRLGLSFPFNPNASARATNSCGDSRSARTSSGRPTLLERRAHLLALGHTGQR